MAAENRILTKSPWPTVIVDGRALHSRYNPVLEAEKFAHSLALDKTRRFYILLECGLEYLVPFIRQKDSAALIISLHVSDFYQTPDGSPAPGHQADKRWSPAAGPLEDFLSAHIPDTEAANIKLVEWRPALAAYGQTYARLVSDVTTFVKRLDANKRTLNAFGRRWFKNSVRNTVLLQQAAPLDPRFAQNAARADCLVAGAGPSLDRDIPAIRRAAREDGLFVIAVCQAAPALQAGGVKPALVVTSDGGNWALFHLFQYVRAWPKNERPPIAACLKAALPAAIADSRVLPVAESRGQAALLEYAGIPYTALPSTGTVSAAAASLALRLTRGRVWTAGMDMALCDIKTHTRGYTFNTLLRAQSARLSPCHSLQFTRAHALKKGGSLSVYAQWFNAYRAEHGSRLRPFSEYQPPRAIGGGGGIPKQIPAAPVYAGTAAARKAGITAREAALFLVRRAKEEGEGGGIQREISELLFKGDAGRSIEEVEAAALLICGGGEVSGGQAFFV